MNASLRRFALTAHIVFSVGWLGAVLAYLPFAVSALTSDDPHARGAAYTAMASIGWRVIVPLSLAALLTGIVQALGTEWGLFKHYWVLAKFVLTVSATTILLLHMPTVSRIAAGVTPAEAAPHGGGPGLHLVIHAAAGALVLLATTVLSVYKPWVGTPLRVR